MDFPGRKANGYSMIELLLVLVIVGIMAVVGVAMLGNRKAASVRSLLDELEGSLTNARQLAVATGRDVQICSWGTWTGTWGSGSTRPLVLAYGDSSIALNELMNTANGLLSNTPASAGIDQTVAVPFHVLTSNSSGPFQINDVNQSRARIVLAGSGDWSVAGSATSSGAKTVNITTVPPFSTVWSANVATLSDANNPFTGDFKQIAIFSASSQ